MRILILGGTRFVGRHLVEEARERGHDVTIFHRGQSGRDLWPDVEEIFGDRETDLPGAFGDRVWDAAIDTSAYVPRVVRTSLAALDDRVNFFAFVSTISVYQSFATPQQDESAPLAELEDPTTEQVSADTYGGLKVLCETEVRAKHPDSLIVRPGIIVGPHDYTDRFSYWVDRIARGGRVACPGPSDLPIQFIDARDLASWVVGLVEQRTQGIFNAVGPSRPLTFGRWFELIKEATNSDAELVWLDEAIVKEAGLEELFPLWAPPSAQAWRHTFDVDGSKAFANGLQLRAVEETVRDTWDWVQQDPNRELNAGPSREQEEALLRKEAEVL